MTAAPPEIRLAELVAALSLATDLGLGLPQEHVLRQTVIATRLARFAELDDVTQANTFYVSLLAWVGCISDSHELSHWFGDDRGIRADSYQLDKVGLPMMRFMLGHVGGDAGPLRRITMIGRFLAGGFRDAVDGFVAHCQTTGDIADRLGLDGDVRRALGQAFERWDGKGVPGELRGTAIAPAMRVVQIADDSEVFARTAGTAAAVEMLTARAGTEFDPELVRVFVAHAEEILGDLDSIDAWGTVVDGYAALGRRIPDDELDDVLAVFADYADLKSPWYLGHSRAVAALAAEAGRSCGLPAGDVALVRRAGLVHRLGATGVSTSIWNKPTALSEAEWERVRQVPYLTERILARQPRLRSVGAVAAMAFERMDGSGYPRGLAGAAIPPAARLLAAAVAYQQLAEARPDRAALAPEPRKAALLEQVRTGALAADAAQAVLAAAGHRVHRRRPQVAGLTAREAEVLALLVRGLSNKQIAARLTITPRTVATHIEHVFAKIGVSTRGAAAMFALRHGLVDVSEPASAIRPM
ncbi:MAG TPA: HD domain-containing phosphohydrolase [Jatrophihabitans sp.]|jgi:HD-GYP domain-containing protein (c-di-GMP phosphodiesterase class II)|uniref:HD domain-containing phosphohydrolase n=1 Tax=Jatrophihabitans sp. TaxID=1932789 RepID=UPI002DFCD8E7|nr:HD domain-containing phosphohydrolase [Jatrophihabitans sp.]